MVEWLGGNQSSFEQHFKDPGSVTQDILTEDTKPNFLGRKQSGKYLSYCEACIP